MLASSSRFTLQTASYRCPLFGKLTPGSLLRRRSGQVTVPVHVERLRGFPAPPKRTISCRKSGISRTGPSLENRHYEGSRRSFPQHGLLPVASALPSYSSTRSSDNKVPEFSAGAPHEWSLTPVSPMQLVSVVCLDDDDRFAMTSGTGTQRYFQLMSALVSQRRVLYHKRQAMRSYNFRRQFSTKRPGGPSISGGESISPSKDMEHHQRTDADFAEYLSGTNDIEHVAPMPPSPPPPSPDTTTSSSSPRTDDQSSSTPVPHFEWQHLHRDHPALGGRPTSELTETYRDIERTQQTNLERSRARTTANVRRALTGNLVIAAAKFGAWATSGSSAMLSEFVHSVVDCGNQALLLLGLRDSGNVADWRHPYGYGKSVYFWALVSALGTFFMGAGISMTHAVGELIEGPSLQEVTWHVWSVLALSFAVDGYVLGKTVYDLRQEMPKGSSFFKYVQTLRDPATLAILLEDGAACLGIVIAIAGIGATQATSMPVFDGIAGVTISALLAAMGVVLVRVNHRFLLGHAVDSEITADIKKILLSQRSIEGVQSVQSQWTGPETFSYKAEVDFDGTFLAAKLMPRYQKEFLQARDTLDQDLRVLLSWYAEDVMRTVERDIRHIEAEIRKEYPGAEYIELEPMSTDAHRFAIDDGMEAQLKRIEIEALNRYLKSLYQPKTPRTKKKDGDTSVDDGREPTRS